MEPLYCVNHPTVETYLRCNRCERPICSGCAVRTPVGYRCRQCVDTQQQVFYAGFRPVHYLIAAAVALPLALVAGWLIPGLGWFAIILGPLVGRGIAEVVRRAIRRRRGRYVWLVVCGCLVIGVLPQFLLQSLFLLFGLFGEPTGTVHHALNVVWAIVYISTAVGAAYASLRPGRRT